MYRIFMVEDDLRLRELVKEFLERYQYEVLETDDFKSIEEQVQKASPDLVLLDVNLPYYDGFYVCRSIRRNSKVPILIMSARSGDLDQIMGIELGADDYIVKPFALELLLAKIKAALRRAYGDYQMKNNAVLKANGLSLDPATFRLCYSGRELELSKNEYKLVKKLLENRDKVVSREELLEELWDDSSFVDDNTLTVNVTRIKSRLKDLGLKDTVRTKRGVGYIFDTWQMEDERDE